LRIPTLNATPNHSTTPDAFPALELPLGAKEQFQSTLNGHFWILEVGRLWFRSTHQPCISLSHQAVMLRDYSPALLAKIISAAEGML
jgi:hypothetical protein